MALSTNATCGPISQSSPFKPSNFDTSTQPLCGFTGVPNITVAQMDNCCVPGTSQVANGCFYYCQPQTNDTGLSGSCLRRYTALNNTEGALLSECNQAFTRLSSGGGRTKEVGVGAIMVLLVLLMGFGLAFGA
ncbi:hypothetical protein KVT40_001876 [Elsinoe batatas]|uniref:Uncharacterized protein n=1 Tax=Elsinoe batatas TaxID=2601811 RepID=A0A8K0PJ77_9PEZI|nr:hypothetical protein KVT40_001876 [Elsinoe batatas]